MKWKAFEKCCFEWKCHSSPSHNTTFSALQSLASLWISPCLWTQVLYYSFSSLPRMFAKTQGGIRILNNKKVTSIPLGCRLNTEVTESKNKIWPSLFQYTLSRAMQSNVSRQSEQASVQPANSRKRCLCQSHSSSGAAYIFSNWILLLCFILYTGVRDCELEYLKNGSKVGFLFLCGILLL